MVGRSLFRILRQPLTGRDAAHQAKCSSSPNLAASSHPEHKRHTQNDSSLDEGGRRKNEDSIEAHSDLRFIISPNTGPERNDRISIYIVSDPADIQDSDNDDQFPRHPIPALQDAFEESTIDAARNTAISNISTVSTEDEAEGRRKDLLDQETYAESWIIRWKQRTSANHHPLLKAVAQITYGMHLLNYEQAESEAAVVEILQDHIDTIDGFLERTDQDFELGLKETKEQTEYLRLLMQYPDVFAKLLRDKEFRSQLVNGNDKLEKVIQRTLQAVNCAMYDHEECVLATKVLDEYLREVKDDWPQERTIQITTFIAMLGNKDGWLHYLHELQRQGRKLCVALIQLRTLMEDMSKQIATASRRNTVCYYPPKSSNLRIELYDLLNKPLPREPDSRESAFVATVPEIQSVVIAKSLDRVYNKFRHSAGYSRKTSHHRSFSNGSITTNSQSSGVRHDSMLSQQPPSPPLLSHHIHASSC